MNAVYSITQRFILRIAIMKYLVALFLITMVIMATLSNAEDQPSASVSSSSSSEESEDAGNDQSDSGSENSSDEEDRRKRDAPPKEENVDYYTVNV